MKIKYTFKQKHKQFGQNKFQNFKQISIHVKSSNRALKHATQHNRKIKLEFKYLLSRLREPKWILSLLIAVIQQQFTLVVATAN